LARRLQKGDLGPENAWAVTGVYRETDIGLQCTDLSSLNHEAEVSLSLPQKIY